MARWRKGSAFDSRSNGWEFDSLPGHFFVTANKQTMQVETSRKTFEKAANRIKTTRHTLLTFLPAHLFQELIRPHNAFFLFIAAAGFAPGSAALPAVPYAICVTALLSVGILRRAQVEYLKHLHDEKQNRKQVVVLRHGELQKIEQQDVNPADILLLPPRSRSPTALIILGAFSDSGSETRAYVETACVDGESGLKTRRPLLSLGSSGRVSKRDVQVLSNMLAASCCPRSLCGSLSFSGGSLSFSGNNVIPRGASVRGGTCVIGLCIPNEASAVLQAPARSKNSLLLRILGRSVMPVLGAYALFLIVSAWFAYRMLVRGGWMNPPTSVAFETLKCVAANALVLGSIIPLSLPVTLDMLHVFHSFLVRFDTAVTLVSRTGGEARKKPKRVEIKGALEDAGMATHALCDKTGTLTKNTLTLRALHIPGSESPVFLDGGVSVWDTFQTPGSFLAVITLLICHSVERVGGVDRGSSQEELAALSALRSGGAKITARDGSMLETKICGRTLHANILLVLPFASRLAKMCVLVEINGHVFLLVKGSDEKVPSVGAPSAHGRYRTLTLAAHEIHPDHLFPFQVASDGTDEKTENEKTQAPASDLASNMEIATRCIGPEASAEMHTPSSLAEFPGDADSATDSEHEVSEHGTCSDSVPESGFGPDLQIDAEANSPQKKPLDANLEFPYSAMNVRQGLDSVLGRKGPGVPQQVSAGLAAADPLLAVEKLEPFLQYVGTAYIEDELQDCVRECVENLQRSGIRVWMLTGDRRACALACAVSSGILKQGSVALSGKEALKRLREGSPEEIREFAASQAVVVYRAAPEDKKYITDELRKNGQVVISVGDGENDVGMIEEADFGVCVSGKEGRKAAFVADAVVPAFSSLARLVSAHGRSSFEKLTTVFFFCIFKSLTSGTIQGMYGITVGASGSLAASPLVLLFYNSLITSPLAFDLGMFSKCTFGCSIHETFLAAILHGTACFMSVYLMYGRLDVVDSRGYTGGHLFVSRLFSTGMFISTVIRYFSISGSFAVISSMSVISSLLLFLFFLGLDGGFWIFLLPSFYLSLLLFLAGGAGVERLIFRFRCSGALPQGSTAGKCTEHS